MVSSGQIKNILFDLGADLCKIASADRLANAPEGFHPNDVFPDCKSVVVFAKAFPVGTLACNNTIPYTIARNVLSDILDKMSVEFCIKAQKLGIAAVPTGTISHVQYDEKTQRSRSIVSAKHCAVAAGLGRIGRNTLVVTPEYGNMVWLNAVLTNAELEPDEIIAGDPCPKGCSLCADNCKAGAFDTELFNQNACWEYAFKTEAGKTFKFKCNKCRVICPNCFGERNRNMVTAK